MQDDPPDSATSLDGRPLLALCLRALPGCMPGINRPKTGGCRSTWCETPANHFHPGPTPFPFMRRASVPALLHPRVDVVAIPSEQLSKTTQECRMSPPPVIRGREQGDKCH